MFVPMMDIIIRSSHKPPFHRERRPVFLQLLSCNPAMGFTQVLLSSRKPISLTISSSKAVNHDTMFPILSPFLWAGGGVKQAKEGF